MREYVTLQCGECRRYNYRTSLNTTGGKRISLRKFCRFCRTHTVHNSRRR